MQEHITVPDVTPIVRYVADGAQSVFIYPFPIFEDANLRVYLDGAPQVSGFTISGAGDSAGGSVMFDVAPANTVIVTLERRLDIERVTDFLEGGDFSAASINNELDYMVAALQQVERANDLMLQYGDHETPGLAQLPDKAVRVNKALGFDGNGDPIAVSLEGSMAAPDFTAVGAGAATRTSSDKLKDVISIKDFGAVGDGLADDTIAIQNALSAYDSIYIPNGSYLITSSIELTDRKSLIGLGQQSIVKCQSTSFNAFEITGRNVVIQNLRIEGGDVALKFFGDGTECTQNSVNDVQLIGPNIGIQLDGYTNSDYPCYWNNFRAILIEQFATHGVHLTLSGVGDTPNANRFHKVRAFSKGVLSTGHGFYVEHGSFNNSFIDCEADMDNSTGGACFRIGVGSNKTLLINLYTESKTGLTNLQFDSGSIETSIFNLTSNSAGAAILDNSGGNYDAYNAGFPDKNRMRKTAVTDLTATLMRFDTEFIDTAGLSAIDLTHSVHIVNATNGAITIELPAAGDSVGAEITIKKVDNTGNIVTITENGGDGPDGNSLQLGGPNDYATVISNGAAWYIKASNRLAGNTKFIDDTGTVDIDMAVDVYLISSFSGALITRLPPANAAEAIGRIITIKKTDTSSNVVTVSEQGGSGPDGFSQPLNAQFKAITVVSNGSSWYILSTF